MDMLDLRALSLVGVVAGLRTDARTDRGWLRVGWGSVSVSVAIAGSMSNEFHVLLITFAGRFGGWAIGGGLCSKARLLLVGSAFVEDEGSGRGDECAWRVGYCGMDNECSGRVWGEETDIPTLGEAPGFGRWRTGLRSGMHGCLSWG